MTRRTHWEEGSDAQLALARNWNETRAVGTVVEVRRDDGTLEDTRTRSEAWIASGGIALVMLEGLSGGYRLDRVTAKEAMGHAG